MCPRLLRLVLLKFPSPQFPSDFLLTFLQSSLFLYKNEKFNPKKNTRKKEIDNLGKLFHGDWWASFDGRFKL